jgi:AAA domain
MGVNGTIKVDELEDLLSDIQVPVLGKSRVGKGKVATASPREIYANYRDIIPKSIAAKLGRKEAVGDRSKVLWRLTNALLECGVAPGEVVVLLEKTVWNKFGDDRSRLWADVNKAAAQHTNTEEQQHSSTRKKKPQRKGDRTQQWSVPVDRYLAVESKDPQWMIEGLWSDKSHGIIAGEPKTRKSYVSIDIALSVATGADCLGHFKVVKPGPVLMIQEEISDSEMRKRLRFIAASKGLGGSIHRKGDELSVHFPDPIPLYLRNRKQLDLSDDETFQMLHSHILEKDIKLLILDPLQLMLGEVDENKASEVRPILYNFLQLKEETGTGIMIVHHYSKASDKNPRKGGQRMLGSQAFHGWVESALYLSKNDKYETEVEREFRNFDPIEGFSIAYVGGNEKYEVAISEVPQLKKKAPPTKFERFCLDNEGIPLKAVAEYYKKTTSLVRRHVEKSLYLTLAQEQKDKAGRPRIIVVKA